MAVLAALAMVIPVPSAEPATAGESTDGKILFSIGLNLHTMELDGSDPVLVLPQIGAAFPSDARWSPGGTKILYTLNDFAPNPNTAEIHIMNADGSGDVRVSPEGEAASSPDWSPDGNRIVYRIKDALVIENADGTGRTTIDDPDFLLGYGSPRWSPDGTKLVVSESDQSNGVPTTNRIVVMNIDGSGAHYVTDGPFDIRPAWSPDGTRIAYNGHDELGDPREIRITSAGGGGETTITSPGTRFDLSTWAANDRIWATRHTPSGSNTDKAVVVMNSDGTDLTVVNDQSDAAQGPDWSSGVCSTHPFSDVPPWVTAAVNWVYCNQHMTGYSDGTFKPNQDISRAQVARLLYRVAGSPDVSGLPPHGFDDVPAWVEDAVRWHAANNTMTGYPDGSFRPNQPITRGQVTRATYRVQGSPTGAPPHPFPDIPAWLTQSVNWAAEDPDGPGSTPPLMTGYGDGTFRPNDNITRAQTARLTCRANVTEGSC